MRELSAAILIGLVLSGCADPEHEVAIPTSGGVTVLVSEPSDAGMEALGGGRLEILGGCLGASGSVIVWPHGTDVVDEEPLTIAIPGYGRFALGDKVRVAGGYALEHSSDDAEHGSYQAGGATVPAGCERHDIFVAH